MKTKPNDSAYPLQPEGYKPEWGLTKREYFAAVAMQALVSRSNLSIGHIAKQSIVLADALIQELNNTPKD
jgi:hypothetical protein